MRAILLAKATRTSIGGLQASMRAIQEPAGAPWRAAQRRTALAPMISRRRRVRSPIFEVAPSFCLLPVECWSGVSPTQAAKSRPRRKVCAGGGQGVPETGGPQATPGGGLSRQGDRVHRANPVLDHERMHFFFLLGPLDDLTIQILNLLVEPMKR